MTNAMRLRVDGPDLRKPDGKKIQLRGVNWGAWGTAEEGDADALVGMQGNVVRLPLRWWGDWGDDGSVEALDWAGYAHVSKAHLDAWLREVDWCVSRGLWVVPFIDSDCGQNGLSTGSTRKYCDPNGLFPTLGRNFWTDQPMRECFCSVWRWAAAQLATRPYVAMLEVLPEPLDGRGAEWAQPVRDFYREVIAAIREVDAATPFLVGPRNAYDIRICDEAWLAERDDCVYTGNLIGGHMTGGKFAEHLGHLVAMRSARSVPVFVQQLGRESVNDPDCTAMASGLTLMDEEKVGYAWWQWKDKRESASGYGLHYRGPGGQWVAKDSELEVLGAALTF